MDTTELLRITRKDAKRLKLALILAIIFVVLNLNITIVGWDFNIGFIVVAVILGRIKPLTNEAPAENSTEPNSPSEEAITNDSLNIVDTEHENDQKTSPQI